MKVVWLFPPCSDGYPNISQYRFYKKMPIKVSIIYPYLAASGATMLSQGGFDVEFMDCPTMGLDWPSVDKTLEDADLLVMEGRTPTIKETWSIAGRLKQQHARLRVVLYGDHVSWNPHESLAHCIDYVVSGGDFDQGVYNLASQLSDGKRPSPVYALPLCSDLDSLPFVDRELVDWRQYYEAWRHRETFLWTMSGRGCFYRCAFCAWTHTLWNNRLRLRSPESVASEYRLLYDKYGECEVLDDADLFDTRWGAAFAEQLLKHGLGDKQVLWAFQTHPNMIYDLDRLRLMKRAGLRTVKLGLESGNQITLNRAGKHLDIAQSESAVKLLKKAGIMVHANLMVGWPWESEKQARHTIQWVKHLDPNQAQFSLIIPYPNTRLYDMARANKWLLVPEDDWSSYDAGHPMMRMNGMTAEEMVQLYRDCWSGFYYNPRYVLKHVAKVHHLEGVRQLVRGYRSISQGHMKAVT